MKEPNSPQPIYLKDYKAPAYLIDTTELRFELGEEDTLVSAKLSLRRNPARAAEGVLPLELDGCELELLRLALDGRELRAEDYRLDEERLVIEQPPERFTLECDTRIKPQENTSLEGLYKSNAMFCTQCEAEGFRKITYYLDRPDVMARFTTTIVADPARYPVLLSNGNPVARGTLADGRHFVTWEDPFKKPAYLFALVAGDLKVIEDRFVTRSGREIQLQIFVEPENIDKCEHAMRSLKKAMRWDEEVYGREYDLDIYMIVAVNDFNMGAMENKGLNIFNSACVLAKPETATDAAYQRIEGVVAHEYFHNWSGNRVTCRDWFQLSLKEGFTVFRDAEFSADMNSRAVKRIEDVTLLRTAQFAEDAGPMAHPVRPASYIEISNFYTLTVYEKGAEVVRMIHTLLGPELFRKGSDLYFERHDGQAVTTDDFVKAMEDASGIDLTQFKRWYDQAGTPLLEVSSRYDAERQEYHLQVRQSCPPTPGQTDKEPFLIPLAVGLLDAQGRDLPLRLQSDDAAVEPATTRVLQVREREQTFTFTGITAEPTPSLLRGFSAPVKLRYGYDRDQLMFLMRHDADGFNRWEAGQQLAVDILQALVADSQAGRPLQLDTRLLEAYRSLLADASLDRAMVAQMLELPSEAYLGQLMEVIDVDAIHQAREFVRRELARALRSDFLRLYHANQEQGAYRPEAESIARRSLKNACLRYLMVLEEDTAVQLAQTQLDAAHNMTDVSAALTALAHSRHTRQAQAALETFYRQWRHDPLVLDQWFAIQAASPQPDTLARVQALLQHEAFDIRNPNKVRSLIGVFCNQSLVNFHARNGAGYAFLGERIIELNTLNPQIAARLATPLTRWRQYDADRQALMRAQLQRILAQPKVSKDVYEVVSKSLA